MAVFNDGVNYYSGSVFGGTVVSSLLTDVISMLTSLGVACNAAITNGGGGAVIYRPQGDSLTGSISNLATVNIVNSSTIPSTGRLAHAVYNTSSTNAGLASVFYLLNASNSATQVTIRGNESTAWNIWNPNVYQSGNSTSWAVATNKSLATFVFRDTSNYMFVATGVVNSPAAYSFPETIYGMYIGRCQGTKYSSFRGVQINSSSPLELARSGNLANFTRVPISGSSAPACLMLPRRSDSGYAIGTMPNIVTVTRSIITAANLSIGQYPIDLNNITTSNNDIDGVTQDRFIYVGNLDLNTEGDDLGDALFMRIYK